jgi:hypothetical protein
MSRHTIMVGIVASALLLSCVAFNVRRAVAIQADAWPGSPAWTRAEESNEILPCCRVEEDSTSAKIWDGAPFAVSYDQTERVASVNASQEHAVPPLQREKRAPAEEESTREEFVLEPIHLLLLGSGLIGLGMLRNRHKRV